MKRYRVSKEASRDLDEVFAYWGTRAGPDIADRLIDAITECSGYWGNTLIQAAHAMISLPE